MKGWVINRNDGVLIKLQCSRLKAQEFKDKVQREKPVAAVIHEIQITESDPEGFDSFEIRKSESISNEITLVSPDIAVCDDCLSDMENQEHRIDYPFINCTNCGPRFTIIRELPYDRPYTTMDKFEMCPQCRSEYTNILDRRFHAQPVACLNCGPVYRMISGQEIITDLENILQSFCSGIEDGGVFAVKGLGGYHLVCDALNDDAVGRLREIKKREGKPFALMAGSIDSVREFADPSIKEIELLNDWKRPIVLLKRKNQLAEYACNGMNNIGFMLPYLPFHQLIFQKLNTPALVMTSGNLSDEPIVISNEEAIKTFAGKVDGVIENNRDIYNRVDDSLIKIVGGKEMIIRRSRAYAPSPMLTCHNTEGILAVGAELVNSFCIGKGNLAIMSQYIGDLKDYENLAFFEETYYQYCKLFKFYPDLIVTDLHPAYLSTNFGRSLAEKDNIPLIQVQHHHAHIASVITEQKIPDKKVIGISMDGMGAGYNGETLGAEICVASLLEMDRRFHFNFVPQPGGDKAAKDPWRMALAYLHHNGMELNPDLPLSKEIPADRIRTIQHMLENDINCPKSSSAGRLFDAVAALLGICYVNTFQAEAPMRLEALVKSGEKKKYTYATNKEVIDFNPMFNEILNDFQNGIDLGIVSTAFHNTIVDLIVEKCLQIRGSDAISSVVLSGGTFQNSYLSLKLTESLENNGFLVYLPETVPVNDQGIALGQLAVAAEMRKHGLIS